MAKMENQMIGDFQAALSLISTSALAYFIQKLDGKEYSTGEYGKGTRIFSVIVPEEISVSKKFDMGKLKFPLDELADQVKTSRLDCFVQLTAPMATEWSFSNRDEATNISLRGYRAFDVKTGITYIKLDVGMNP